MATPLMDSIQALINYSNETTGENDTSLSEAIDTLVSGYGSGGSGVYELITDFTLDKECEGFCVNADNDGNNFNLKTIKCVLFPALNSGNGSVSYARLELWFNRTTDFNYVCETGLSLNDECAVVGNEKYTEGISIVSVYVPTGIDSSMRQTYISGINTTSSSGWCNSTLTARVYKPTGQNNVETINAMYFRLETCFKFVAGTRVILYGERV